MHGTAMQWSTIKLGLQIYCLEHDVTDIVNDSPPAAVLRSGEGGPGQPRVEAEDGEAGLAQQVDSEEAGGAEGPLYSLQPLPRLSDGRDHSGALLGNI